MKEQISIDNLSAKSRKEYLEFLTSFKQNHPEIVITNGPDTEIERFLSRLRNEDAPHDRNYFMRLEAGLSEAAKVDSRKAFKEVVEQESIAPPHGDTVDGDVTNNRGRKKKLRAD